MAWRRRKQPFEAGRRSWAMVDQTKTFARHLVRALYYATCGKSWWWRLPRDLNNVTRLALEYAVDRGWLLMMDGHSVCLTDAGRELVMKGAEPQG